MTISFESDNRELTIKDSIGRRQFTLTGSQPLSPSPVSTESFRFPVDDAVRVQTTALELPVMVATYIRNSDGEMISEAEHFTEIELQKGDYSIELCPPIKLYVRVNSALTVEAGGSSITLTFEDGQEVDIGARSHHEQPAGTITTTEEPADVMTAVSMLSSSLKSTTPERSFPTLRGFPPLIERGDTLDIPPELESPNTGIRIEIPPELQYVYVVAPLAFYLGADVVAGDRPRIVTNEGFVHELDSTRGFERETERVLKQTFFMDCVVRTEGLYKVTLHERQEIEPDVELGFETIYHQPLNEQLEAYLEIPYEVVRDQIPQWNLTMSIAPEPRNMEVLPFGLDELAVVRTTNQAKPASAGNAMDAVSGFTRSGNATNPNQLNLNTTDRTGSLEHVWIGDGIPVGATKGTLVAFKNKLNRTPVDDEVEIAVVCNDEQMAEEGTLAESIYESQMELPFSASMYDGLTTAELREVLESNIDVLHYIGHIDHDGFICKNGPVDATHLQQVGVDVFVLNACSSFEQGMALIEAGAIGGVVTTSDVPNEDAVQIGTSISRLLTNGFPLRSSLEIAGGQSNIGTQYTVIGDGSVDLGQPGGGIPGLFEVSQVGEDTFEVTFTAYPTSERGMGAMVTFSSISEIQYLSPGVLYTEMMTRDEFKSIPFSEVPLLVDGELRWARSFLDSI